MHKTTSCTWFLKTPATNPVTYDYFVKADTSTGGVGGNGFIQLNVVEAKKLPATKLAEEGVYYLLTADDGNFTNGTYLASLTITV